MTTPANAFDTANDRLVYMEAAHEFNQGIGQTFTHAAIGRQEAKVIQLSIEAFGHKEHDRITAALVADGWVCEGFCE